MDIAALEKMLAAGRDSAMLRFGLGKAYLDSNQPEQALAHLQLCVDQDPEYSAAWKLLGRAGRESGDAALARSAWQQGLAVARAKGDKQLERELSVFLRKLDK